LYIYLVYFDELDKLPGLFENFKAILVVFKKFKAGTNYFFLYKIDSIDLMRIFNCSFLNLNYCLHFFNLYLRDYSSYKIAI